MKIQKTRKETIIDRLLEEKTITPFEAAELLREDYKVPQLPLIPPVYPQQPYTPYPQQPYMPSYPSQPVPPVQDWKDRWINDEMNRRAGIADRCPCNPKNGGSGICGCVLTGPIVMC